MAFNYERIRKKRESGGNEWTSYSDLFTCLAFLFLMMYVSVSLRSSAQGVQQGVKLAEKDQQLRDMREQMRAYDSVKNDYLQQGASPQEQHMYRRLMDRLTLLQDESNKEKQALEKKAQEQSDKELALNQYQKIIRNIINANMVAQSKIKNKEEIIQAKNNMISDVSQKLTEKDALLTQTNTQLKDKEAMLAQKSHEVENLAEKLRATERDYEKEIDDLQAEHDRLQAEHKQRFMASLKQQKLSAESRIAKEREFRRQVEEQNRVYDKKLGDLNDNLSNTKNRLAGIAEEKGMLEAETKRLKGQADRLAGDLKRTQAIANHKRELAKRIQQNLARAGVDADVDVKTGDVTIAFGREYFETNEAQLKPGMKNILEKFVPVYASSLFTDPSVAKEIRSVELIGFASPTYKSRYVDPGSLKPSDRNAVNYNMDLSYQRAKSIFNYIFDTKKIHYQHQDQLLPLVKVTGRSYLASKKPGARAPASTMNAREFCKVFNCQESQKVIIKFNLEE